MSTHADAPPWGPAEPDERIVAFVELPSGGVLRVRISEPNDPNATEIIETVAADGGEHVELVRSSDSTAVMQRYNALVGALAGGDA